MAAPQEPAHPETSPGAAADDRVPVFTRRGQAWCEVTHLEGARHRVRLGGLFHTAWMATLCNALAERRVSIDHMHARLGHDLSWIAELHVLPLPGAADPRGIGFIELAEGEEAAPSAALRIDSYRVLESRSFGGTLALSIEAHDSLGLLGSLLAQLAALGLYPVEMHIETHADRVYDSLWLRTADGQVPPPTSRSALVGLLSTCVPAT